MLLQRWYPFHDMRRMRENGDRLRRGAYPTLADSRLMRSWAKPLEVVQEGDNLLVQVSLAGLKPRTSMCLYVSIEENVLTIKGKTQVEQKRKEGDYLIRERRTGFFRRSLRLPDTADTEQAHPNYEQGVLTGSFPRLESKKARQLPVTTG